MRIGVVFPQTEFGNDPQAVRDYAQTAEALGYNHILAYDHVLGASPDRSRPLNGPYTVRDPFHEIFILFSFMSAYTARIEFTTGILILPQRETALVAKQAAALDVLNGGRLRLGVGIGWNWVEYEALNQDFHTRGRRIEEQVDLLRKLWTQPLVTYKGEWHDFNDAGLNPLPIQQPIPIWFGGHADAVLRRVARSGDGWLPNYRKAADARPSIEKMHEYLDEIGRDRSDVGLEPRLWYGNGDPGKWQKHIDEWLALGATHLTINTMRCGFESPAEH
ncbi:MAG: LLM class F420-dependent oxidoreductase, partial [Candidatus Promineifilaceae bacterium]